jgi:hypothetical protein
LIRGNERGSTSPTSRRLGAVDLRRSHGEECGVETRARAPRHVAGGMSTLARPKMGRLRGCTPGGPKGDGTHSVPVPAASREGSVGHVLERFSRLSGHQCLLATSIWYGRSSRTRSRLRMAFCQSSLLQEGLCYFHGGALFDVCGCGLANQPREKRLGLGLIAR